MIKSFYLVSSLCLLLAPPASAQRLTNDGFQRRNGQMHILRNGQIRPMLRDAHLPTGAIVTKDGFVVGADGKRTELREGQGCDLRGNPVAVVAATGGGLALGTPAPRRKSASPAAQEVRAVLDNLLGGGYQEEKRDDDREEYDEKYEEKARERRNKEDEWQREDQKRREEHSREREKKWKEKWKKKKWDD
jgi:hypothetical protein